jgi:hypothetical protein
MTQLQGWILIGLAMVVMYSLDAIRKALSQILDEAINTRLAVDEMRNSLHVIESGTRSR